MPLKNVNTHLTLNKALVTPQMAAVGCGQSQGQGASFG